MKKIKELEKEIKRLRQIVAERDDQIVKLESIADRDFLTGLYNRQGFIREVGRIAGAYFMKTKERRKFTIRNFSIIFIDLDNLKRINDLYGHKAGDKYIKGSSEIFEKLVRDVDIVARWGGDEFIIGLVGADTEVAVRVAEKMKQKLGSLKLPGVPKSFKPSASFGIVNAFGQSLKGKEVKFYELIEKGDKAMYEAKKKNGKGAIISLA